MRRSGTSRTSVSHSDLHGVFPRSHPRAGDRPVEGRIRRTDQNQYFRPLGSDGRTMSNDTAPRSEERVPGGLGRRRFLGGAVGIGASIAAIPALSGVAAAHFPVELDIDVQPGNEANFIDLDEHDRVSVEVHPSEFLNSDGERETFDPTERDVRYRLGARSALDDGEGTRPTDDGEVTAGTTGHGDRTQTVDVLSLSFPVEESGLDSGNDTVWLYWERDDAGEHGYSGFDTVSVYGGGPSSEERRRLLRRLLRVLDGH